jgi:hypothetical protein
VLGIGLSNEYGTAAEEAGEITDELLEKGLLE